MIVGRFNTLAPQGYGPPKPVEYLRIECPSCRQEFDILPGNRNETISRAAMCPDCRNDEGFRRSQADPARYTGKPSPFHLPEPKPRLRPRLE